MTDSNSLNIKAIMPPLLVVLILSFIRWQHGVLLFHTLAELFSVIVGVLMLVIVWNTRQFTRNDFLTYLGIGHFWIAVLDTWHTFTVEGMPFFGISDAEITLHFWIYTRFLEAVLLLSASLFLKRKLNASLGLYGGGVLVLLIIWGSVALKNPVMLTPDGLTAFKVYTEYLVIVLLGLSMYIYVRKRELLASNVLYFLLTSIALTIFAELSFTLYTDFNGIPFVIGHLFKFLSFWMIYQAIVQTTLTEPFSIMAQDSSNYDAIPHPTIVVDSQGVIAQVNRAAVNFSGKSAQQLIHRHVHQFFHLPHVSLENCDLCQTIKQGIAIEGQVMLFPEKNQWFLTSLAPIRVGDNFSGIVQSLTDITERKQSEETLRKQEKWLSQVLNTLPYGVQENDTEGVITFSNVAHHHILGLKPGELIGRHIWDFKKDEKQKQQLRDLLAHLLKEQPSPEPYVTANKTGDGREVMVEVVWDYQLNNRGKITGFISVISDITRRKQAEEKLISLKEKSEQSESKFKAITNQSTEGITVADADGNYTFVNPAFCEMIGYSEKELLQMTVFDVKAPEQDTSSFARTKGSEEGLAVQVLLQRKDGTVFISEVIGKVIEFGGQMQVLGTIRDITEQVKAEEQIRTLSLAIEQSPVSVMITDTDANIEYVNSAFENVTGYSAAEVIGMNPRLLKSDRTYRSQYQELWQTITSGKPWQGELQNRKKNGEIFWEYSYYAPVIDDTGVIRHYLAVKEDITLRKQQEEQILHQAHFDTLTDLPNRFLSLDRLSQLLNEAQRDDELVAILFLDLDDFKKINDTLGHETGDKLLIEAAERLRNVVRSGDTVGRLGGDEFIVLLGGLTDGVDAHLVAENLLNRFKDAFRIDGRELMLTVSIGIAFFPGDGDNASELLRNADSAMYHSKELGRNTYSYFTEAMNRDVSRRLALEEQIHGALDRGEFSIVYQPQIKITSGKIMGAEALLRWFNPALGNVSPVEFIPIAEQTGLIVPLGQFVLTEALNMTAYWQKEHAPGFRMAVNLSPRQFRDPDLVKFIEEVIRQSGVTSESLELEITEGLLMNAHAYISDALTALNNLGVSIAMDDFGTGYSSLSYLRSYPFDVLKIDKSFIRDITADPAARELINATVAMAHGLNLKVIAEGVETEEQFNYLKDLGCEYAQGYLFSKPVSIDEITGMLKME